MSVCLCGHEKHRHDPEDGECDAPALNVIGKCPCKGYRETSVKCPTCGGSGEIEVNTLGTLLTSVMMSRDISGREAAAEIGISPSTFSRVLNGESANAKTLLAIVRWSGVAADRVLELATRENE